MFIIYSHIENREYSPRIQSRWGNIHIHLFNIGTPHQRWRGERFSHTLPRVLLTEKLFFILRNLFQRIPILIFFANNVHLMKIVSYLT